MFTIAKRIHLHDTDAAGRLYFAQQFRIAHEAFESFMAELGFPLEQMRAKSRIGLPIVHAEADYKAPVAWGDALTLALQPIRVGQTSFTMRCRLIRDGQTMGWVTTVHVAVTAKYGRKCALPARLRSALLKAARATGPRASA